MRRCFVIVVVVIVSCVVVVVERVVVVRCGGEQCGGVIRGSGEQRRVDVDFARDIFFVVVEQRPVGSGSELKCGCGGRHHGRGREC